MGLGILESRHNPVPGTALVYDDDRKRDLAQSAARSGLKYDKTGKILLVPQPSDDPNDPLVSSWCALSLARCGSAMQNTHIFIHIYMYTNTDKRRPGHYGNAI